MPAVHSTVAAYFKPESVEYVMRWEERSGPASSCSVSMRAIRLAAIASFEEPIQRPPRETSRIGPGASPRTPAKRESESESRQCRW